MDKVAGTAAFRRFLGKELGRCARGGYADAVLARYRSLSAAAGLDEADAQEHAQLFNRLYTRWALANCNNAGFAATALNRPQIGTLRA